MTVMPGEMWILRLTYTVKASVSCNHRLETLTGFRFTLAAIKSIPEVGLLLVMRFDNDWEM